ncbi:D-sedoheptulose 7-phosphate isomerase [Mailhella massiliensis]|uniref:Phosphoheptose isomerase n=1 Tax=Mailhella massiliensis TaxID=1903261 RepID=A0A921DRG9_9BACT|nr:D-sedoheptulose 7-phosphate isomerase [Mailhella massiliensis]HJD96933.1 D-sedoheptulose 7-phosphate isomerase [Mailhella massiliensis]
MQQSIINELSSIISSMEKLKDSAGDVEKIVRTCTTALKNGNKILFCGNGGSAAQAQHLAAELVGRYKKERRAMAALSLTVDTSNITAIGNDYGYDDIFRRQLEGLGQKGDVLIGLSTSGNSKNVLLAFELARAMGVTTVAFTGEGGGKMKELADICIAVPSRETNHIQEMHITLGHILCGLVEEHI